LVCNAHNVEYSLYERLAALAKEISARKWHQLQAEANRQLEQAAFETCNLTFCCSEEDARLVRKLAPLASVSVIPNGVDIDYFREGTEAPPTSGPRVIFTGGMNYDPNRDAVEYFVAKILPLIRQRQPTCRFCIAGSAAQSNFAHLAKADPSIEIASDVPDMRPYFAMSDVVVVPLRAGSGTRTKIFEAMAMGRAVVSTTLGAEGIACTPGVHLCLADTPESFAAQVTDLLGDAEKRRAMGQSARRLVCERFDWSKLREEAIEIIMERMVFQLKNNEALLESED
jgi:glycosyltransferase involved in cell wall biosynthesis